MITVLQNVTYFAKLLFGGHFGIFLARSITFGCQVTLDTLLSSAVLQCIDDFYV